MKLFFTCLMLWFVCTHLSYAQAGAYQMGARAGGLAGSTVTYGDEWSLFNNIGGLSYHTSQSGFISYQVKYGLAALSSMAGGYVRPAWNGTAGIGFFRFGDHLLSEQKIHIGFSNQFAIVSLGLNLGLYQIQIEGLGSKQSLIIDFGGQARLTNQFYFGAHVSNLSQSKISNATDRKIPTYMKTGLSYRPHQDLMLNIELEKSINTDEILRLGLEYQIIAMVHIRTGMVTKPFESSFGIGFQPKKLILDYAYTNKPTLGSIHEMSISYCIKK